MAQGIATVVDAALAGISYYIPADVNVGIPERISALERNHPNPFSPSTTIAYRLPDDRMIDLAIFASDGSRVATLVHDVQTAGEHSVAWNGIDDDGRPVASGVYLYRIKIGDFTQSRTMTLVR